MANPAPRPEPPTPAAIAANKRVMRFSFLMLATLITSMIALPGQLVTIPVAGWAAVEGIGALRACRAAKIGGAMVIFNGIAVGLVIFIGLSALLVLPRWDIEMANRQCQAEAVTNTAQIACANTYQQDLKDFLNRFASRAP